MLEGPKVIDELLQSHPELVRYVVVTPEYRLRLHRSDLRIPVYTCSTAGMQRLANTSTPQAILAVIQKPAWHASSIFTKDSLLAVYGEKLQDPSNIGTLVRLAASFGLDAVCLSAGSADAYNPKAIRASAGAWRTVPVFSDIPADFFGKFDTKVYAAETNSNRATLLPQISTRPPKLALAFGSEGVGLSRELLDMAGMGYTIPTCESVESLNVAAAAAIALYHFHRLPAESGTES